MFDEDELLFILGHELVHMKAGLVLYGTVAWNIGALLKFAGEVSFGIGELMGKGVEYSLLYWSRQAELTADRAGLLCIQDLRPCILTLMKLAGGAKNQFTEMDPTEFERQADEYDEPEE